MNTTDFAVAPPVRRSRTPWTTDLVGAGAAAICALVLWTALVPLGGLDLAVAMNDDVTYVGAPAVAIAAFVAALGGLLALRILERFTRRALAVWTVLAVVVLAVSLAGPLGAQSLPAMLGLIGLHTTVAAVVLAIGHLSRR